MHVVPARPGFQPGSYGQDHPAGQTQDHTGADHDQDGGEAGAGVLFQLDAAAEVHRDADGEDDERENVDEREQLEAIDDAQIQTRGSAGGSSGGLPESIAGGGGAATAGRGHGGSVAGLG